MSRFLEDLIHFPRGRRTGLAIEKRWWLAGCSSEFAFPLRSLSRLKILRGTPKFGHGRHKFVCSWLCDESTLALVVMIGIVHFQRPH